MKKFIIIAIVLVVIVGGILLLSGKKGTEKNNEQTPTSETQDKKSASSMADVCNYFPKELVESAIGKPIVKMEVSSVSDKTCLYYTTYSETYDHTPYGDKPGGAMVVVVYDDEDFVKDRV
ncbi:MAG: hypothetical protein NT058_00835, partial [Candidatus Portnoybacteria bacterium]|nr:hypothetical protein [Candidatus Portnoybacteria bacterium]